MNNENTDQDLITIGVLAERTGCSVPTIRYYEEIQLIPPPLRRASGHRVYPLSAVERLVFIRHCREFGFPIEDIKALMSLASDQSRDCSEMRKIAEAHLVAVRTKLAELRALDASLAKFVNACSDTCATGAAPQCSLIKDLAAQLPLTQSPPSKCCG